MTTKTPQSALAAYLISEIRRLLPPNMELAKSLEPVLELSRGTLYKRLRGESAFTTDELVTLARHFQISIDHFVLDRLGIIPIEFPALAEPVRSARAFLASIEQQLLQASQLPGLQLFYASAEIPLFCYLKYPELTAFKLYMWSRTTWLLPEFQHQKFSYEKFPDFEAVQGLVNSVRKLYCQIDSCEFWSLHMLENTLNQIDFLAYEGGFAEKGMERLLCEQIQDMLLWQRQMAEGGRKIDPDGTPCAKLLLYHNEIAHTNNTFLLQAPGFRRAFFTFDNPNYASATAPAFCDYVEDWFGRLQRCSSRMSEEGEKQRIRFFGKAKRRLGQKMEEIFLAENAGV